MSAVRLHLDEDADAHALLRALRQRGVDVTSTGELAFFARTDEEQLDWSLQHGRVIYTYNASDFCRLHVTRLRQERSHAGIIIGDQQTVSIGEQTRRILKILEAKSAEEMINQLEYLNHWK